MSQLRADVAVAVAMGVDAVAVAAVDGTGVVADAAMMTVDDGAVGVEMGVELDVDVDSTPSGCTTAHNEQNQTH